jgi:hypothetical protein
MLLDRFQTGRSGDRLDAPAFLRAWSLAPPDATVGP